MAITSRSTAQGNIASGKGFLFPFFSSAPVTTTSAAALSNNISSQLLFNNIGTAIPATLVSLPIPNITADLFPLGVISTGSTATTTAHGAWLVRIYKLGTVDLANAAAAPYNGFTADPNFSGTLNRTIFESTTQPINMIPIMFITTATTTTAPVFILKSTTGTTGYVNQAGSNVVGTLSLTLPNIATGQASVYFLRMEAGDSGVRQIVQMDVTTKSSSGVATIFGMEIITALSSVTGNVSAVADGIFDGLNFESLTPAVPTSGTCTSYLALLSTSSTTGKTYSGFLEVALSA